MSSKNEQNLPLLWWLPLVLFVLVALFSARIDLALAEYFYRPQGFIKQVDPDHPVYSFLFNYGEVPGQLLGIGSIFILILEGVLKFLFGAKSTFYCSLQRLRRPALVVAITFFLGAGLFVNVLFKDFWGRPRPKQLVEFGGTESFRPFYSPIWNHRTDLFKSFPSGHAAMGFLFLALGLIGWYEHRPSLYVGGICFALGYGCVLSYTRVVQGGHFLSDVLASAILMWLLGLLACRLVYGTRRVCIGL